MLVKGEIISARRTAKILSKLDDKTKQLIKRPTTEEFNNIIAERIKKENEKNSEAEKREDSGENLGEFKSGPDSKILAINSPALSEISTCMSDFTAENDSKRTEND